MTDLYIATLTQANHDALMRLAESAGYKWHDDALSTVCNLCDYVEEEENIVHLYDDFQEGRRMAQDDRAYYESQNVTIETIPNLANIKAIWKVQPDDHKTFFKGKSYKHPLPSDKSIIMLEMADELAEGLMDIYKALAVEYKPEKSEDIMPKKVKLSRRVELKIKLTLDEKYKELVDNIVSVENPNWSYFFDNYSKAICDLTEKWFCDESYRSQVKVIERIHSADEIEFIKHKYNWRLKSDKFLERYIGHDIVGDILFFNQTFNANNMTESEFKKLLEGIGLPFEAFEGVKIDEEDQIILKTFD